MDGWMDGWFFEGMIGTEYFARWIVNWFVGEWLNLNGWMNEWTDGWMVELKHVTLLAT